MGRNKLGECPLLFSKYLHLHTKDLTKGLPNFLKISSFLKYVILPEHAKK